MAKSIVSLQACLHMVALLVLMQVSLCWEDKLDGHVGIDRDKLHLHVRDMDEDEREHFLAGVAEFGKLNAEIKKENDQVHADFDVAFEAADSNKDGILDWTEWIAQFWAKDHSQVEHDNLHEHHMKADEDGNGLISKEEFISDHKEKVELGEEHFKELDTNEDGILTPEEHKKIDMDDHSNPHFNHSDTNKDGELSREEFMAPMEAELQMMHNVFQHLDESKEGHLTKDEINPKNAMRSRSFHKLVGMKQDHKILKGDFEAWEDYGNLRMKKYFLKVSKHYDPVKRQAMLNEAGELPHEDL